MRKTQRECFALLEQERRTLASNLHDEIGQYITAIRTTAALIQRQSEGRSTYDTTTRLLELITQLDSSLRRMLQRLWPTALENLGLEAALDDLATFSERYIACKININWDIPNTCDIADDIADDIQLAVYRIVQESISNAITHGNASKIIANIHLQARSTSNTLYIQICDNGCGIDSHTDTANVPSIGCLGMKNRIAALDGTFSMESIDAATNDKIDSSTGLCLQVSIPLTNNK